MACDKLYYLLCDKTNKCNLVFSVNSANCAELCFLLARYCKAYIFKFPHLDSPTLSLLVITIQKVRN